MRIFSWEDTASITVGTRLGENFEPCVVEKKKKT